MTGVWAGAKPWPRTVAVALSIAVVAGLAFGGVQLRRLDADSKHRHDRAQVLRAVRTEVVALTDISATTTDKQIHAFLDGMTSRLKDEFKPQADAFRQAMVQSNVQSRGRVVAVGLTEVSARRVTAVVAAAARVSNARTTKAQDRSYRLRLSLTKVGGRWLVDTIEFVP
ncbi:Mce-associated membrane protein [Marmoricola sp. URHA0025 HA25]